MQGFRSILDYRIPAVLDFTRLPQCSGFTRIPLLNHVPMFWINQGFLNVLDYQGRLID